MKTENDLIQKLMVSKAIMDKHQGIKRGSVDSMALTSNIPTVEGYEPVNATYNIPQELMSEMPIPSTPKPSVPLTKEKVLGSKLPDEIKRLMLEHPISQPQQFSPTLSDEVVEKAARLMGTKKPVNETYPTKKETIIREDNGEDIKKLMKETIHEVLKETGLIGGQNTKDTITIKVGNHIFQGTINKIKKVS
jgi:hypothetical protein